MKLEIDSEKVKEAAEKCPVAMDTLKVLFPEVFEHNLKGGDVVICSEYFKGMTFVMISNQYQDKLQAAYDGKNTNKVFVFNCSTGDLLVFHPSSLIKVSK